MSTLDAVTLLALWDAGASQPALRRALMLLTAAWPERSTAEWAALSIGERDECLVLLREELFGAQVEAAADCPACGNGLDVQFRTRDIASTDASSQPPPVLAAAAGDYDITCRKVTTADLLDLLDEPDMDGEEEARVALLRRCVQVVDRDGAAVDPATLPADLTDAVQMQMSRSDPHADVSVRLTCPACSHDWSMRFDILAYLWGELDDWARRLLVDVHALASTYGWSERDIVAMSPRRRRMYLELVGA